MENTFDDGRKQTLAVTGLTQTQQLMYNVIKVVLFLDACHNTIINEFVFRFYTVSKCWYWHIKEVIRLHRTKSEPVECEVSSLFLVIEGYLYTPINEDTLLELLMNSLLWIVNSINIDPFSRHLEETFCYFYFYSKEDHWFYENIVMLCFLKLLNCDSPITIYQHKVVLHIQQLVTLWKLSALTSKEVTIRHFAFSCWIVHVLEYKATMRNMPIRMAIGKKAKGKKVIKGNQLIKIEWKSRFFDQFHAKGNSNFF